MPDFIFAYHGGNKPETEEAVAREMAAWGAWFEQMGQSVVQPGNPVGMSKTVSAQGVADNGGANPLSGYTVIKADSMEAALEIAKGCPMIGDGSGTVEVAEIIEM